MYQTSQNENRKLKEELEKNEVGINKIKKAAHDFSQFNLHGRERTENFKKNGVVLARELDNSFSQFPYGWVTGFEDFTKSLLEDFIDKQENENLVNQLISEISQLTAERDNYLNATTSTYNSLVRERDNFRQRPTQEQLQEKLEKITSLTSEKTYLEGNLSTTEKRIRNLENELEKAKAKTQELQTQLEKEKNENQLLNRQLTKISQQNSEDKVKGKKRELEQLKIGLKNGLGEDASDDLDSLLEAQEEFTKSGNSYAQKQLEKAKKRLLVNGKLTEEKIEKICKEQEEFTRLEVQLEKLQEQQHQTTQEVLPKE